MGNTLAPSRPEGPRTGGGAESLGRPKRQPARMFSCPHARIETGFGGRGRKVWVGRDGNRCRPLLAINGNKKVSALGNL